MQSEADKEERTRERQVERDMLKNFIDEVKEVKTDIRDIKTNQTKTDENYSSLAKKMETLENQMKDLQKKEVSWPTFQPERRGSVPPFPQTSNSVTIHPPGVSSPHSQPSQNTDEHTKIYKIVKQAKKTLGFSPISENDIKVVMEENHITNRDDGMMAAIKDFLLHEMAIPLEVSDQLKISKIFRPNEENNPESEKVFVEFSEDNMPGIIFKYVRKLNHNSKVLTYIPPSFRARAADLEKCAYNLRHSEPAYNTKIRWGTGDLILERKLKSNPEDKYRDVTVSGLPPVDLNPPPPIARTHIPSSSPAPGRRDRSKRPRNVTPTHSSPSPKSIRQEAPGPTFSHQNRGLFSLDNFRSPARTSDAQPSPIFRKAGTSNNTQQDF